MMRLYSQKDVDKKALRGARIAVLGYGSQGRAHALNLKDSGFDVVVGVRKGGTGWKKAKKDGLEVAEPVAAARGADLVAMLVPDLAQKSLYDSIEPALESGATLLFAHGFNIHFKQIKPRKDLDVVLIAPKGPGDLVRRQYQQGRGISIRISFARSFCSKISSDTSPPYFSIANRSGSSVPSFCLDFCRGPHFSPAPRSTRAASSATARGGTPRDFSSRAGPFFRSSFSAFRSRNFRNTSCRSFRRWRC